MQRSLHCCLLLLLLALVLPGAAWAQTRAWLDRDRVELGETVTLNIETDQGDAGAPDWTPLDVDFAVSGHTSRRQPEPVDGGGRARVLFAVALQPRREGLLTVPGLRIGGGRSAPLTLTVVPASTAPARAGAVVFLEAEADSSEAFVQQAIGYVLRLYYATPLVSGQLLQPQPEGASLQRLGNDLQYSRDIDGRRYTVVERRFLLVPERSGTLTVPGAQFTGRGSGSFFDDVFGGGPRQLRADGAPRFIEVRPVPDAAPRPWLPLHALEMRYLEAPQAARVGEAATVVVELTADGATAAQLGGPELGRADGAEVFAEPAQTEEYFERGRPQVRVTRRFSIVPTRAGSLAVEGPSLTWWDARAGRERVASLPPLAIEATAMAGGAPPAPAPSLLPVPGPDTAPTGGRWMRLPGVQGEMHPWAVLTVVFALLWLVTLAWGLQRRRTAPQSRGEGVPGAEREVELPSERARLRRLRTALDTGDLGEVADALCALAVPAASGIDALRARLAAPAQRAALDALERARWAGGEPAAARAAVREAFANGPSWEPRAHPPAGAPLPPLYPERRVGESREPRLQGPPQGR